MAGGKHLEIWLGREEINAIVNKYYGINPDNYEGEDQDLLLKMFIVLAIRERLEEFGIDIFS